MKRSPEVYAKRREIAGMFFKWLLRFYYKHSPTCSKCGWAMKPIKKSYWHSQWKCIWKKCGWEVFDNGDGKLHWLKN
jgi:hypothetical protein